MRSNRKYCFIVLLIISCGFFANLNAQDDFYESGQVREIKIYFELESWKAKMDSLFLSGDNYTRIKADVVIDGDTYPECGVRYKGFSSWNSDEIKNPLNISLDYTYENQNHQGYIKLKLSNVIYDPSFVREALSYEIARNYFPASGANYANLYINDTLIGLYSNVEAVDDCFVQKHFNSDNNPFFKGNPETLSYPFGQNANLAYTHGDDSSEYMDYYKLESDEGWEELFNLINVLNNDTASISNVLNIDRALWMHAFNYTLLNLDSYIAYAQNYYLYQDDNDRFNTMIWDLNMSFGSFRHSDGSLNFSGVTIEELASLDPLQHLTFSISPRPLMENLFQNSTYQKMYIAHIRTILTEEILSGNYLTRAEELHEVISPYVLSDTNKFYSFEFFEENVYNDVGESTELYPGLQDLTEARAEYLLSYPGMTGAPECSNNHCLGEIIRQGEEAVYTVDVIDADEVYMYYRFSESSVFASILMSDDGNGYDEAAGDQKYTVSVIPDGNIMEYYFWAENDSSGTFFPAKAGYDFFDTDVVPNKGDILINEVKYEENASSDQVVEWIELYNASSEKIQTFDQYIGCDNQLFFVDLVWMEAYSYFVYYPSTFYFTNFESSLDQNYIYLTDNYLNVTDSVAFIDCANVSSYGSFPDGTNNSKILEPSPGRANQLIDAGISSISIYPNPALEVICFSINATFVINELIVCNSSGKKMEQIEEIDSPSVSGELQIKNWPEGLYFIYFKGDDGMGSRKFVKM